MEASSTRKSPNTLTPYLSPLSAWALSIGAAVGWGSLVVTSTSFLGEAGLAGSIVGLLIGVVAMVFIARNYSFMMNLYPDSGGIYTYVKSTFGYDRAYLASWFLILTYLAMFWANATSLPLFVSRFFGDVLKFGYLYTVFGYDVYAGEALLTIAAIIIVGIVCARGKSLAAKLMILLALTFTLCITICFVVAMANHGNSWFSYEPLFLHGKNPVSQIMVAVYMTPWAFIGFESISHSTEEMKFGKDKSLRILMASLVVGALLYLFLTLLSVSAYPSRYPNWFAYISNLDSHEGYASIPAFYAAKFYLGDVGVALLTFSLLALVITSLVADIVAVSRLLRAGALDDIFPEHCIELNKQGTPEKALLFIVLISLIIPFVGRTAIGWIVDVTTVGAIIVYGFVSASAYKVAKERDAKVERVTGVVGMIMAVVLGAAVLLPTVINTAVMAPESYMLFAVWSIIGFAYFRIYILEKDTERRFGNFAIVWVVLLSVTLLMSITWMEQTEQKATKQLINDVTIAYREQVKATGVDLGGESIIEEQFAALSNTSKRDTLVVMALFGVSLGIMVSNFTYVRKREEESYQRLGQVQSVAYTDPLTGVKSKHAFVDWEQKLEARIGEREDGLEFAIVVLDVNGLKHVNDTLGHKAGDRYIKAACQLICRIFDHSPVFRIGGDEFTVILERNDYQNRDELIQQFRTEVEENLRTGDVVISEGVSLFDATTDGNVQVVFERADNLMYERKMQLKAMGAITRD